MKCKLLAAAVFLLPVVAAAKPTVALYVDGQAGANFAESMLSSRGTTKVYPDNGALGEAALG